MTDIELQKELLKEIEPLFKDIESKTVFDDHLPLVTQNSYNRLTNTSDIEWVCPVCKTKNADQISFLVSSGSFWNNPRCCKGCGKQYTRLELEGKYERKYGVSNIVFYKTSAGTDTGFAFISSNESFRYNKAGVPESAGWEHTVYNFGYVTPTEKVLFVSNGFDENDIRTYKRSNTKFVTLAQRFGWHKTVTLTKDCPFCGLAHPATTDLTFILLDEMLEKKKRTVVPKEKAVRCHTPDIKEVTDFCFNIESVDNTAQTATYNAWCVHCDNVFVGSSPIANNNITIRCPVCGKKAVSSVYVYNTASTAFAEIQDSGDSFDIIPFLACIYSDWSNVNVFDEGKMLLSVDKKTGKVSKYIKAGTKGNYVKTQKAVDKFFIDKIIIDPSLDIFKLKEKEKYFRSTTDIAKYLSYAVQNNEIPEMCDDKEFLSAFLVSNNINICETEKEAVLGVSKEMYELAKVQSPSDIFEAANVFPDITPATYAFLMDKKKNIFQGCSKLKKAVNDISCEKMCEYIKKVSETEYIAYRGIIKIWTDYINNAKALKWDISDNKILFPDGLLTTKNKTHYLLTGYSFDPYCDML